MNRTPNDSSRLISIKSNKCVNASLSSHNITLDQSINVTNKLNQQISNCSLDKPNIPKEKINKIPVTVT